MEWNEINFKILQKSIMRGLICLKCHVYLVRGNATGTACFNCQAMTILFFSSMTNLRRPSFVSKAFKSQDCQEDLKYKTSTNMKCYPIYIHQKCFTPPHRRTHTCTKLKETSPQFLPHNSILQYIVHPMLNYLTNTFQRVILIACI